MKELSHINQFSTSSLIKDRQSFTEDEYETGTQRNGLGQIPQGVRMTTREKIFLGISDFGKGC